MTPHADCAGALKGRFIVFEGIDGTGKSTQVRLLAARLTALGCEVVQTREPTDGPYGMRIRELYANRGAVSPAEELELFLADRRQHVREVVAPALAAGRTVLSDRYYLSTAAYQGAKGMDPLQIIKLNEAFAPKPDLFLLLVLDPAIGVRRIQDLRGQALNSFEQEDELRKVAAIFADLQDPVIHRIDGSREIDAVHRDVVAAVRSLPGLLPLTVS